MRFYVPDGRVPPKRAQRLIQAETQERAEAYANGGFERILDAISDPAELLRFTIAVREASTLLETVQIISKQDAANHRRRRPVQSDSDDEREPGQPPSSLGWT